MKLDATPQKALVDERVTIRVAEVPPGKEITLRAHLLDADGNRWESHATFAAGEDGTVDVATQAPLAGSYQGADSMGLFWSMHPPRDVPPSLSVLVKEQPEPTTVKIATEVDGQEQASVDLERLLVSPDVAQREVRDDGLVATLFLPPGDGPHPAVIVMTGSDGGLKRDQAALLASHGFATLALAFFGIEHLPEGIHNVPLEYFQRAIAWLQRHDNVDGNAIGVTGISRGGELVLLLGATFPEIRAVAAYSPSSLIYPGFTPESVGDVDSWTFQGKPFEYAPFDLTAVDFESPPIVQGPAFYASLEDPAGAERGAIPVERINGPVLLVSGADDQQWPASQLADLAMRRLQRYDHPFPVQHLRYDGAGHLIRYPYVPTTSTYFRHPVVPMDFALGGEAAANAHAVEDSWTHLVTFFGDALR